MNNYVFIIWNKALFCKDRILKDLSKVFDVEKYVYIKWKKENFIKNSKALYGHKSTDAEEKSIYTGKGKFLLILIKDNNPVFKTIDTIDGVETVNANVINKKWLYRKWTADNFRIHASTNEKETNHDLLILLGDDCLDFLKNTNDGEIIEKETIAFKDYKGIDDLKKAIELIDDSYFYMVSNDKIDVFALYKEDINNILNPDENVGNDLYIKKINEKKYFIRIYGEKDGDLPSGFISRINNDLLEDFADIQDTYDEFLENRSELDYRIESFLEKYGFDKGFEKNNPNYKPIKKSIVKKIKDKIKYFIAIIVNR